MLIYFLQDFYDKIADQIFKLREQREKCTVNTAAGDAQIARINELQDFHQTAPCSLKHRRTNASQLVLNPAVRHFSTIYFFKNFAISSTSSGCHESEFNTPLCHIENLAPASVVPQPLP